MKKADGWRCGGYSTLKLNDSEEVRREEVKSWLGSVWGTSVVWGSTDMHVIERVIERRMRGTRETSMYRYEGHIIILGLSFHILPHYHPLVNLEKERKNFFM